jgi:hypothetical protein
MSLPARWRRPLVAALVFGIMAGPVVAQVQVRIGDPGRIDYSELHDRIQRGSPEADSALAILGADSTRALWPIVARAAGGQASWNDGLMALTRIAELRDATSLDSVRSWRRRITRREITPPPGEDLEDLLPGLHAIELELDRARRGDQAVLDDLLPRIPAGDYDLGDAWVFGRLGSGAADSVARRVLRSPDQGVRIRCLTLLSFSTDTTLIPLLERIYVAPDSFGLPVRIGIRASDGLLWIGTPAAVRALLTARDRARARGTYADPRLSHADLDFLANDSSMAVSRTGGWISEWLKGR